MAAALRAGHATAPSCTTRSTGRKVDVVVDAGYEPATSRATPASRRPSSRRCCARHDVDEVTVVGLATDYCVQAHRARRPARGLPGDGRPRRDPRHRRRSRATRSARSTSCAPPAPRSRDRPRPRLDVPLVPPGRAARPRARACSSADGVIAAVVPAAPERAVVNAVLYRSAAALEAAYDELAVGLRRDRREVDRLGAARRDDEAAARFLESRGHVLDAQPVAMGHDLDGRRAARRRRARRTGPRRATSPRSAR